MLTKEYISKRLKEGVKSAVLALLCAAFILPGCQRRPLEDPDYNTRVKVQINTRAIMNVTCDIYNEKIPVPEIQMDVMHVIFFKENSDEVACESYITDYEVDENGQKSFYGNISIAPGTYRLYAYNFGTETTLIREPYVWDAVEAYPLSLPERISSAYVTKVPSGENFTYSPDHLVVARSPQETIPFHSGIYTVNTEAKSVVESYYLQIKVEGLEYVNSASAVLSGMSSANYITRGERVDDPQSTIYFTMQKSDDDGKPVICAIFNTFGRPDTSSNDLEVTFDLQTRSGKVQRSFNISDLFLSEDCINHHWLLLDEVIHIDPPKPDTGGGFEPEVVDWENENHEILL